MTVIEYVTEEVRRQGHDVTRKDGLMRVSWMICAWAYAMETAKEQAQPEVDNVLVIGRILEPHKNADGIRNVGVRVGNRVCPHPKDLVDLLNRLWTHRGKMEPIFFYKEFEEIHPFVDGNGRTGKILLNWLNGTLHNPIFPPADLFGHPILNP